MKQKYPNKLKVGDRLIVETDAMTVTNIEITHGSNYAISFENAPMMVISKATKLWIVDTPFTNADVTIEEMYNLVLDDEISLVDFAEWCKHNGHKG